MATITNRRLTFWGNGGEEGAGREGLWGASGSVVQGLFKPLIKGLEYKIGVK